MGRERNGSDAGATRRQIRLYPDRTGAIVGIGCGLVFVLIGVVILVLALVGISTDPTDTIGAAITIAFFGFTAAFWLHVLLRERRAPLLTVTPEGIAGPYSRYPAPVVPWSAVSDVAIYRGEPFRAGRPARYYLVALVRDAAGLRDAERVEDETGDDWMYPDVEHAGIALPLAKVYPQGDLPAKGHTVLARIRDTFAAELERDGVALDREVRVLPRLAPSSED
jgi:hypothetical protein